MWLKTNTRLSPTRGTPPRLSWGSEHGASLELVGDLLAISRAEIATGRLLLGALGDPLTRAVLARISRKPCNPATLVSEIRLDYHELKYKIRVLTEGGALIRKPHHIYAANSATIGCVGKYMDILITISAYTQHGGTDDR